MYYVAASVTILWGILLCFVLPPDPIRAKGFNERERYILVARLRSNNSGVRNKHFKMAHVRELLVDIKFWLSACISFLCVRIHLLFLFPISSRVGPCSLFRLPPSGHPSSLPWTHELTACLTSTHR